MLAIFLAQCIDALVKIGKPLQPNDFAKQIELAVIGLGKLAENDARCPIQGCRGKEIVKRRRHNMEDIVRETGRPGEIHLKALVAEVLRSQEDQYALGGELVFAQFYARVLNVFGELGENKIPV